MILIISTNKEYSTDNTIEWLIGRNEKYLRLNTELSGQLKSIVQFVPENDCVWEFSGNSIHLKDIKSVWFRRGYLQSSFYHLPENNQDVRAHLFEENQTLRGFIYKILSNKKSLNHPDCYNMNKLIALQNAVSVGLEIPDTIVTQSNEALKTFKAKHVKLISKPIQDSIIINEQMYRLVCTDFDNIDQPFGFTLFQEEIPKRVELRVFYLDGKCFTAAVFPDNEQSIDGYIMDRKDDKLKRIVPFQLPQEQQDKIKKFMELSNLNCGSLDIILTPSNHYVFLEVNPVGQFDYVSKLCNYYLEREIADYLAETTS